MKDSKLKHFLIVIYEFFSKWLTLFVWRIGYSLRVMTPEETIHFLIKNRVSIARYGDGEFDMIAGKNLKFQDKNNELSKRLENILKIQKSYLLICIPRTLKTLKGLKQQSFNYWYKWGKRVGIISTL